MKFLLFFIAFIPFIVFSQDPVLEWSNSYGFDNMDHLAYDTKFDHDGNIIVIGSIWDTVDFDPSSSFGQHIPVGIEGYILKLDPNS